MSPRVDRKYKYFHSTVQTDRGQNPIFVSCNFKVMLGLFIIQIQLEKLHFLFKTFEFITQVFVIFGK